MGEGRRSSGFPCPECGCLTASIIYMDNHSLEMTLHCDACEHTWHLEGYAD